MEDSGDQSQENKMTEPLKLQILKKRKSEARKVSQGVMCVLCNHEELNSIPSTHAKSQVWRHMLYSKLWEDRHTKIPGACWLPAESTWWALATNESPFLQYRRGAPKNSVWGWPLVLWSPHKRPHMQVYPWTYTHAPVHEHSCSKITSVISRHLVLGS